MLKKKINLKVFITTRIILSFLCKKFFLPLFYYKILKSKLKVKFFFNYIPLLLIKIVNVLIIVLYLFFFCFIFIFLFVSSKQYSNNFFYIH